jgi:hypothetical protein
MNSNPTNESIPVEAHQSKTKDFVTYGDKKGAPYLATRFKFLARRCSELYSLCTSFCVEGNILDEIVESL